ncbi:HlyIII-domain-containing protein [Corynespora cassiicola Philippines]|uniref:HlyIII-domain-containing protein n=1 Tax=Corynespora cassiicola Philippines TaxID=1448308 RepID=A0A2T2NJM8_CORCC|nr:HlyIII-domain-containing protein [Corynespora cassiicola Philippines]
MGENVDSPTQQRNTSKLQNKQESLADAIQNALRVTRTGHLLTIAQLPAPWRINPFVVQGYTFAASKPECLHTVFRLSNESFNIWSHVLGVLSITYLAFWHFPSTTVYTQSSSSSSDYFVVAIYLAASTLCLTCSVFWHTMKCHCDPHFMISCASVDLTGVTLMISAMNMVMQYAAFYCEPSTQLACLSLTAFCCTASVILGWSPKFRHPDLAFLRVLVFSLLGIVGVLPMAQIGRAKGWDAAWALYRPLWIKVITPVFSGAWIYAGKVPERWWPGVFDFAGHSHNVWHIAVLMTIWGGYSVSLEVLGAGVIQCQGTIL